MPGIAGFGLMFLLVMLVLSSPVNAQSCTGSGISCSSDCTQLITCVGGIQFTAPCPTGSFCDPVAQDCSATSCSPTSCNTYTFQCTATGTFPDPYSCSHFIKCLSVGGTPTNTSCPSNTLFDPCTASCSTVFTCTTPRVQCKSNIDSGPVPGNSEIFYTCNSATNCGPVIRKCNDEYVYSSTTGGCVYVGTDVCKEQPYTCVSQGFYPDPNNCTVYYYCDPNLNSKTHVCKPGYHFVQSAEGCLSGSC